MHIYTGLVGVIDFALERLTLDFAGNINMVDRECETTDIDRERNTIHCALTHAKVRGLAVNQRIRLVNARLAIVVFLVCYAIGPHTNDRCAVTKIPDYLLEFVVEVAAKGDGICSTKQVVRVGREGLPIDGNGLAQRLGGTTRRISVTLVLGEAINMGDELTAVAFECMGGSGATKTLLCKVVLGRTGDRMELGTNVCTIKRHQLRLVGDNVGVVVGRTIRALVSGESDLVNLLLYGVNPQHGRVAVVVLVAIVLL